MLRQICRIRMLTKASEEPLDPSSENFVVPNWKNAVLYFY